MRTHIILLTKLLAVIIPIGLIGCASIPDRTPVPAELTNEASIPGIPEARFWADEWPKFNIEIFETYSDEDFQKYYSSIYGKPHNYLAISGGGANGAFGAGLLYGWTESGTRPEFSMVTGISTGALTAPYAFLGSEYDEKLKEVYTTISTNDIVKERGFLGVLFSDSIADTEPLKQTIARYITDDVVQAIALEHQKGRRLFIGTVNLDASRSVIWNIGAIAESDYPEKVTLIREVMRASAAIPIAFPPVIINIEVDGQQYDELHVDGGTGAQVFAYPAAMNWKLLMEKLKVPEKPNVYILRNSFIDPDHSGVRREILPIASKTIESLIRTQGIGDLYQIYTLCNRDGNEFNLAYIPPSFTEESTEGFDPVYMAKLFELGREMALNGYPWEKLPPGYETEF